jgi:hypothetical protein
MPKKTIDIENHPGRLGVCIVVFGGLGGISGAGAILSGLAVFYQKFISSGHLSMNRNPLLNLTVMLFIFSVQFILMGLLAEILVRTYHESQNREIYVVQQVIDNKPDTEQA